MQFVYNTESIIDDVPSIFLAGPTPRSAAVASWRKKALPLLESAVDFDGAFVLPEDRGFVARPDFEYAGQIEWERTHLASANVVLFWIPRDLKDMPAFTTNIEFGFVSERNQHYVLGFPKDAAKMRYLEYIANKQSMPIVHDLEQAINISIELCSNHQRMRPKV